MVVSLLWACGDEDFYVEPTRESTNIIPEMQIPSVEDHRQALRPTWSATQDRPRKKPSAAQRFVPTEDLFLQDEMLESERFELLETVNEYEQGRDNPHWVRETGFRAGDDRELVRETGFLPTPTLTLVDVSEGAAHLTWTSVRGATHYVLVGQRLSTDFNRTTSDQISLTSVGLGASIDLDDSGWTFYVVAFSQGKRQRSKASNRVLALPDAD